MPTAAASTTPRNDACPLYCQHFFLPLFFPIFLTQIYAYANVYTQTTFVGTASYYEPKRKKGKNAKWSLKRAIISLKGTVKTINIFDSWLPPTYILRVLKNVLVLESEVNVLATFMRAKC